jgi:hypothetical protein
MREGFDNALNATNDVRFGELLPSMITAINGKIKHLNILYGARYAAQQTGFAADDLIDFMISQQFTSKYLRYRNNLAYHLHKNSEISYSRSLSIIDDAMIAYLVNAYKLSIWEATRFVKVKKISARVVDSESVYLSRSQSLPVKIRGYLETTPVPNKFLSTLEKLYYIQILLLRGNLRRATFYLQLGTVMSESTQQINTILRFINNHAKALGE